jgi:hypothetical protein
VGEERVELAGCVVCAASAGEEGAAASFGEEAILKGARAAWQEGALERQIIPRPVHHHNETDIVEL